MLPQLRQVSIKMLVHAKQSVMPLKGPTCPVLLFLQGVLYNHMKVVHTFAHPKPISDINITDSYWLCDIFGFHSTDVKP
jgi:hypothetical protein